MSVSIQSSNHDIAEARDAGEDITFSLDDGGETLESLVAELARTDHAKTDAHRSPAPPEDDEGIVLLGSEPPSLTLGPTPRRRRAVPARLTPPMPRL